MVHAYEQMMTLRIIIITGLIVRFQLTDNQLIIILLLKPAVARSSWPNNSW